MRIKQLDYIVKVVELGSVNEAAKHLLLPSQVYQLLLEN